MDEILKQTGHEPDALVETVSADAFFERLIAINEWFGDSEKERAARFARLKAELAASLSDLTVFRIGRIRIDIYVVGIDAEGRLAGIATKSVET